MGPVRGFCSPGPLPSAENWTRIRRRTKNMNSSQRDNLFQTASECGQGCQRFFDITIQNCKRTSLKRVLPSGYRWSCRAADGLIHRGHCYQHHLSSSQHNSTYPCWSLGHQPHLSHLVRRACASWHKFLVGSSLPGTPGPPGILNVSKLSTSLRLETRYLGPLARLRVELA